MKGGQGGKMVIKHTCLTNSIKNTTKIWNWKA